MSYTRREFVAQSAAMLVATSPGCRSIPREGTPLLLFQGDSITDGGRDRAVSAANDAAGLGSAYPSHVLAMLRIVQPYLRINILNRGVSGDTVADLTARWQRDTLDVRPTILSILIGVNDVWHTLGQKPAAEVIDKYRSGYNALLDQTRAALPGVRIVVLEPFVLHVGAVTDAWFPEFDQLRAAAAEVASRAGAQFVPLHDMFQERARATTPEYWAADGVHPTPAGHDVIAKRWIDSVKF